MDASHFDALARNLSLGSSRRRVLAFLSGGLLGALGVDRPDDAAAKNKKKNKKNRKNKKKKNNSCDWFAGEEPCGTGCCNVLLGNYCCGGQSCCPREKGCSSRGLCSECPPPNDPCLVAVCNSEGLVRYDPRCQAPDTCYPVNCPGPSCTGVCKGPCAEGYTICVQPNGTPVCCHTNPPPGGTPAKCEGGFCVAP
jgi:hypothetical protein